MRKFDPAGLSGGAIWRVSLSGDAKLVGIMTDYDPKRKMILGTRTQPLLAALTRELMDNVTSLLGAKG